MALLTLHTVSSQLKMTTVIHVILPDSVRMDVPMSERKVLYLLHGLSDDSSMWVRRSLIENEADKYGLIVVMPSVDRSFYCDGIHGQNYFTYLTVELPEYLHKVFNISTKKSDTLIAGLSMGGYGAMRAGLAFPEQYFAVGSFSGVLSLEPLFMRIDPAIAEEFPFLAAVADTLDTTPLNPVNLLPNAHEQKIYVSCGLQDDLLISSQLFEKRAKKMGVPVRFSYSDGKHDWTFWNHEIGEFLRYVFEGK